MRNILIVVLVLILTAGVGFVVWSTVNRQPEVIQNTKASAPTPQDEPAIVEAYIRQYISTLAPEKEVLGGTFHVTNVNILPEDKGIVEYEDGHNAFTADFTYSIQGTSTVSIISFTNRS
jgi:hypothetical protein